MKKSKKWIPGAVLSTIMTVIVAAFIVIVAMSQMLPVKYLVLSCTAVVLVAVACALFMRSTENKFQFTFGAVIAILMSAVLGLVAVYLQLTMNTLNKMTEIKTVETPVGIFVRAEDPAVTVDDAKGYTFGVLSAMDTENTEKTVEELNARYGAEIETVAYDGLVEIMDGLLNGETDAMILNIAYLEVFDGFEGYEDVESRLRELEVITIKTEMKVEVATKTEKEHPHIFSVYIGGSDSRGSLSLQARNDVNIVLTINTETRQVLLVTTPRDYFVPLSISGGARDKLTHGGIYGIEVSKDTLAMLYDTDIDYYFRINFVGVQKMVDALGGVTVNNQYAFTSYDGNYYPAGEITLNSSNVLGYARDRKNSGGDEARGKRQMEIIEACINKAMSPDILMRYTSILESLESCINMTVPYSELATIVRQQLSDGGDWNIQMYAVSGWGDSQKPYSMSQYAYVMWPDEATVEKAQELMRMVKDGEIITDEDLVIGE